MVIRYEVELGKLADHTIQLMYEMAQLAAKLGRPRQAKDRRDRDGVQAGA